MGQSDDGLSETMISDRISSARTETQCIDVCVITFKRPVLLAKLLSSLENQRLPAGFQQRIIVVDNDKSGSACAVVREFAIRQPTTVYALESQQGVSYARNRALSLVEAPYFAFVDDDEEVGPQWLAAHLTAAKAYCADVVIGPVVSVLPPTARSWVRAHPMFRAKQMPTGHALGWGATNNAFIRSDLITEEDFRFDPKFALTGGEDTDFFKRVSQSGRKIIWCSEASVREHVSPERANLGWMCRRAFRGGQNFAQIFVLDRGMRSLLVWMPWKAAQLVFGFLVLFPISVLSMEKGTRMLTKICGAAGQLSSLFGRRFSYAEYDSKRYRSR